MSVYACICVIGSSEIYDDNAGVYYVSLRRLKTLRG